MLNTTAYLLEALKTTIAIILTFLFSHCLGQTPTPNGEKLYYDTLKLLLPKPSKENIAVLEDYKHCIALTKDNYQIVIKGKKYLKSNFQELSSFVKANRSKIVVQRINIIYDSTTDYKKIVNTLDLMMQVKITNFRLASVNGIPPKPPEILPIIIKSTKPFTKDIELSDTTVLIISISSLSFETTFLGSTNIQSDISQFDSFLSRNKENIDPNKIVVTAGSESPYKIVEPVLSMLNKHGYHDYHLIPKD